MEPKPTITIGPSIRAYTGHFVIIREPPGICAGDICRAVETEEDAAPWRSCRLVSGCVRRSLTSIKAREIGNRRPGAGRADQTTRAFEDAGNKFAREQPFLLVWPGQPQRLSLLGREAEAAVVRRIPDQQHSAIAKPRRIRDRAAHQRGADVASAKLRMHREWPEQQGRASRPCVHVPEAHGA